MTTYIELENMKKIHSGEVCIFGGGILGRYDGYELITAAGFHVDFYCDNHIASGIIIRDEIKVKELQYLYNNKDNILVFLCMGEKYQEEVLKQLASHEVNNVITIDRQSIFQILDSIDSADDMVKRKYHVLFDDVEYLKRKFKKRTGYNLNLKNPKTFNEKLQWLKLYDRNPEYTKFVDKYEFKNYITKFLGSEYVIPTIGVWDSAEEIEWDNLPEQFVLKCTHDSGSAIICKDKNNFDIVNAVKRLNKALKCNYFWGGREWPYKNVKPRIIMEPYLEDASGEMIDYKFLCYGGRCKYVFTCTERYEQSGLKVTFFDRDWNKLNIKRHYPFSEKDIKAPLNYKLMLEMAERISEGYPFVRIDFYEINGRLYVGEFTLYPGSGFEEFENYEDDALLGVDIICGD